MADTQANSRWSAWGEYLKSLRERAGFDHPSSTDWAKQTGIDRNKWRRWEAGNKPDYDGLLELAAFLGISVPQLVARIEGEDYAPAGDRTWAEIGQQITDEEFLEMHEGVRGEILAHRAHLLTLELARRAGRQEPN